MKKKYLLLAALVGMSAGAMAQKKGFSYKFYGQVRADLFYNTRTNSETVDGLFYMYPLDKLPDADGNDLNDQGNGNLYALYSRVGVDVAGPMLGKAKTRRRLKWTSGVREHLILCSVCGMLISILTGELPHCWWDRPGIRCMEMLLLKS